MERLLDGLPALEDLAIGGHPGPIGTGSAIAVVIGGLFLLYRGLIDYRIPLLITFTAFASFLVLPIPVVMDSGTLWRSLFLPRLGIDGGTAVTFVNYEMMASPLLFSAFFLATAPAVRPMARCARTIYALLTGMLTAASQLYLSVSYGPYVALLLVSLLTPWLDRWFASRPWFSIHEIHRHLRHVGRCAGVIRPRLLKPMHNLHQLLTLLRELFRMVQVIKSEIGYRVNLPKPRDKLGAMCSLDKARRFTSPNVRVLMTHRPNPCQIRGLAR